MARSPSPLPWILVGLIGVAGLVVGLVLIFGSDRAAPPEPVTPLPSRGAPDAPRVDAPAPLDVPPPGPPVPYDEVAHVGVLRGQLVTQQRQVVRAGTVSVHAGDTFGLFGTSATTPLGMAVEVGETGRFEIPDVPARDDLVLRAEGAGFSPTEFGSFQLEDGEVLDVGALEVRPTLSIAGTVFGANSRPLAGARVAYDGTARTSLEGAATIPEPSRVVLTDDAGRFEFVDMQDTHYELLVSAEGYANQVVRADPYLPMIDSLLEHSVWLERATPLEGRVYAKESGEPVPGLSITAMPTGTTIGHEVTTSDEEGRFRFDALVVGDYNIIGEGPGRMRDKVHVRKAVFGEEPVELWLDPSGNLEGTVVGPEGEPVKRFDVSIRYSAGRGPMKSAALATDRVRNGIFRFDDLRAGFYTFEVWAPGYAPLQSEPRQLEPGQTARVQLQLRPAAVLRGRVIDDRDQPVRGAKVSLHTSGLATVDMFRTGDDTAVWYKSTTTDVNGRFELADIMGRRYQVEIDHPDYAIQRRNDVVAREGRTKEEPPFILETPGRIEGVVRSTGGAPLAGAMVNVGGMDTRGVHSVGHRTRTNARGEYSFRRLPPGEYMLEASVPLRKGEHPNPMALVAAEAQRTYQAMQEPEKWMVDLGPGETRVMHLTVATP